MSSINGPRRCCISGSFPATPTNTRRRWVFKDLVLTGRLFTADAAFCHRDVCQTIVERDGHFVLPVKDNQPQLVAAISSEFTADNAVLSS